MRLTRRSLLATGVVPFALAACGGGGGGDGAVRLGQATTSLSFLPIWAARAFDTFAGGPALTWAAIPGGDPAALAALDAGDIDIAAVGSDTAVAAIERGQPFELVYIVMGKLSLEVTVAPSLAQAAGVSADSPLEARLAALKGAVIGVSAVGGAQDRAIRWMAARAGLDPRADIQVAQVGAPPALQAALENNRIQGFILSPPEAGIAQAHGYGVRLIEPGRDFPELQGLPFLVLAAKRDADEATAGRIRAGIAALQKAAQAVLADPAAAAEKIRTAYFPNIEAPIMAEAVTSLAPGLESGGRFEPANLTALARFAEGSAATVPEGDDWWTNRYFAA